MSKELFKYVFQSLISLFIVCIVSNCLYAEIIPEAVWLYDTGLRETGEDLAVDGEGNVYVTVTTFNWFSYDYYTVKYDPSGNIVWFNAYDNGRVSSDLHGVAVDPDNNVYVTGNSFNGIDHDCLTIRYDEGSGDPLWENLFDGGNRDTCADITTDGNGHVYVAGTHNMSDTEYTYLIMKYDSEGNLLCSNTTTMCDLPSECTAGKLTVDGNGNIYITGIRSSGIDEIAKFDSACLFVTRWSAPPASTAADIIADEQGHVCTIGSEAGLSGEPDYLLVRYDSLGNEICRASYDGGGYDRPYGIAAGMSNTIYVTGFSHNGSDDDILTLKYDLSCNEVWTEPFIWDGGAFDHARAIALDEQENVYVTGYTQKNIYDLFHDGVTLKFACSNSPVRIDNPVPQYYFMLQDAYDNAGNGDVIQGRTEVFTEDLTLDHNVSIHFEGGCDCDYLSMNGLTTVEGDVTIIDGSLTIQDGDLEIR